MKTKIVKGDLQNVDLDFAKKIIEISQTLISTLNLNDVIKILIKQSREIILCEKIIVWLYDEEEKVLYPHSFSGIKEASLEQVTYKADESIVGWVFSNKKALIEPNIQKSTLFVRKSEFSDDIYNVMCVPITFKDNALGILYAANKTKHFDFTSENVNHLTLLANYSAIAIYNSRLYNKLDADTHRIKGLYEISSSHMQEENLTVLLEKMLLILTNIFDFSKFSIFLFDSNAFHLKFAASLGYSKELLDEILFIEDDFIQDAIENNKMIICNDLENHCIKKLQDDENDLNSVIIMPMYADTTLIGILTMGTNDEVVKIDSSTEEYLMTLTNQMSVVIQNNIFYNTARFQIQEFQLLRKIFKNLQNSLSLTEVLNKICIFVTEQLAIDTCSILLYDDKTELLVLKATKGFPQSWVDFETMKIGDGLIGWCAKYKEELIVKYAQKDPRFVHRIGDYEDKNESFLGNPILYKTKLIGVLIGQTLKPHDFIPNEVHTFGLIADEISLFIEKAKLFNELKDMYTKVIRIFSDIIELQNPEISGHCDRVARYSDIITKAMNLEDSISEQIRIAAYLHDIDKLGLKLSDLKKSGKFSFEKDYIKKKEIVFDKLIDPFNLPVLVKSAIKHLHENYDGTGYPDGLTAEDIPLEAKILAIANTLDKYSLPLDKKKKPSITKAFTYLKKNSGTLFDPHIIKKLLEYKDAITQIFDVEVSIREVGDVGN
ncbi:GAF domain-containing protein [Candidatus Dependentiae bacterium]|nr:GAF domain-containing protein [Candidatus Dependentiae bacterium]